MNQIPRAVFSCDPLELILGEIPNPLIRFVFPSETTASRWAGKICGLKDIRSVALNRFLAWDRFKEEIIRAEFQDRRPVSAVIRKLFAEDLVRQNAAANTEGGIDPGAAVLPFRFLIPPEFAGGGAVFVSSIAACLPSLMLWESRSRGHAPDGEDRDLGVLKKIYSAFLERRGLFEPAWKKPPLRDRVHGYYIFFPEAMEDFADYEEMLRPEPSIHFVHIEENGPPSLRCYDSARAEIRSAVLEIREFHEQGIPYEDMAISAAGLEEIEPYLLRELSLYNVPYHCRWGRSLGDFGTGRLFFLINNCAANNFSFSSLKSLLLNEQLPWRYPELNRALIEFGVKNNCVSAYREKNRIVDVWTEAFRIGGEEELGRYYRELKGTLKSLAAARNFAELRSRYFAFRGGRWECSGPGEGDKGGKASSGFFSRNRTDDEGNAILARCVEELSALVQLEEEYPELIPPSPFGFFLSVLQERQYVPLRREGGVNIFRYRVAAGAPYRCHFVLNVSQEAATVLYRPLKFLRQDKRRKLGLADTDASAAFFRLYRGREHADFRIRISASRESFSGWAMPHSFFAGNITEEKPAADAFGAERAWWAAGGAGLDAAADFPSRLFSIQREGFVLWREILGKGAPVFSLLETPFPEDAVSQIVRQGIMEKQRDEPGGLLKVSATADLNPFFKCPALWLYRKIFGLEEFSLEARLLDDASLGLLYHEILRNLFTRIRDEDGSFKAGRLETYRSWLRRCTDEAARHYRAFRGPLAAPILVSLSAAISRRLGLLLKTEVKYFDRCAVGDLEKRLQLEWEGMLLGGVIDRVSFFPEGGPAIIDYKTGGSHSKKAGTETGESEAEDFQIPLYVKLYEAAARRKVEGAFFMLINRHDIIAVVGSPGGKRGNTRDEYEPTLAALEEKIGRFRRALEGLDFAPRQFRLKNCLDCDYKTICRTAFFLPAADTRSGAETAFPAEDTHVR